MDSTAPSATAASASAPAVLHHAGNRFTTILVLGALSAVSPFSIDLYLPAFPQMAVALHCTTAQVSLSLASYFVGLACGQLFYGPLLDRYGRKLPLYAGLLLYIATSLACLAAPNVETLIALRFLQALGGCVAQVASVAMVRDFFPVADSAKVFSLLMLILGVSPLLAPSIGTLITAWLGWHGVFYVLAAIVALILAASAWLLPPGQPPDRAVVLRPRPILAGYLRILAEPRFHTYALAGACSFAGLFVYVAGSPIIFLDFFAVSQHVYGLIFAGLAAGFIGANQVNILLSRRFAGGRIFNAALACQVVVGALFLALALAGWCTLPVTIALLFAMLACSGFSYPNASALALAPLTRNLGSASALLGFLQMGVGALASSAIGVIDARGLAPIVAVLLGMAVLGVAINLVGRRRFPVEQSAN